MKKTCLLLLLLSIVTVSHAQFQTGKKVIGGQLGFATNNNNYFSTPGSEQRVTQFSTSFSLARFKSPTLLNGFGVSYSYNRAHNNIGSPTDDQVYNSHNITAFINSTKLTPLAKKFYLTFTGNAGVGYGFSKTDHIPSTGNYSKGEGYNLYVSGDLGLLYQLNERFLFTTSLSNLLNLSYHHGSASNYSGSTVTKITNNSFNLNSGLTGFSVNNISVGVKYILK